MARPESIVLTWRNETGCYETPGLTCLRSAHIDLEGLTLDREVRALYVTKPPFYPEMID